MSKRRAKKKGGGGERRPNLVLLQFRQEKEKEDNVLPPARQGPGLSRSRIRSKKGREKESDLEIRRRAKRHARKLKVKLCPSGCNRGQSGERERKGSSPSVCTGRKKESIPLAKSDYIALVFFRQGGKREKGKEKINSAKRLKKE